MADEEFMYTRVIQSAFDGAVTNYRLENVGLISGDSDTLAARELKLLWQRINHAKRNNGIAKSARRKFKTNTGIIKVKWKDSNGKINKKMQKLWDEFAENPNLDGYGNLANTQDEWLGNLFDGEAICRMIIKRDKNKTIPLALQNIPKEYLDPMYSDINKLIKNSIEFDKNGKPLNYHFNKILPKTSNLTFDIQNSIDDKVIISSDDIIHIFEREESGQWRGIPFLACVLLTLYGLDDLTDATVQKQLNAQAVSWIIKNTNPTSAVAVGTGRTVLDPTDIDSGTKKARKVIQGSGGGVQYLNKGEELMSVQGEAVGAELIDLVKLELHKIAQASGLTYQALTGDITGVNLSTLQQLAIELKVTAEYYLDLYIINLGLKPLCKKFKSLAIIYGNSNFENLKPTFQYPKRYSINNLKDVQADLLELQSNLALYTDILAERDLTVEEIEEDRKLRESLGISFDTKTNEANKPTKTLEAKSNSKG